MSILGKYNSNLIEDEESQESDSLAKEYEACDTAL